MKKLKFAIMAALIFACSAPINQETVNFEDETILIGKVNWEGLTKPPFNDWFRRVLLKDFCTLDHADWLSWYDIAGTEMGSRKAC